jgi:hypothetical protein
MSKLANRIRPKTRCECYPCRNKADIALGPIERKGLLYQICREHAEQIRDDLTELLADEPQETEGINVENEEPAEGLSQEMGKSEAAPLSGETESGGQISDNGAETPSKDPAEPQNVQHDEGEPHVEQGPAFACKHCGEPFEKKTDLMSHAKVCPNRPPKES